VLNPEKASFARPNLITTTQCFNRNMTKRSRNTCTGPEARNKPRVFFVATGGFSAKTAFVLHFAATLCSKAELKISSCVPLLLQNPKVLVGYDAEVV